MKRNAKPNGSGGRLRLATLLATAAAFLLVPAAQAAAEGELKVNLAGTGVGEVTSAGTELTGVPPIECSNIPGEEKAICENKMVEIEPGAFQETLKAIPGPGSVFDHWTVDKGLESEFGPLCFSGKTVPECLQGAIGSDAEITATFVAVNVLTIDGAGAGNGTVSWKTGVEEGTCTITEGSTSGECEVNPEEFVPTTTTATAAGGSEFVKWAYVGAGTSNCTAESGTKNPCNTTFFGAGEEGTLTVTFDIPPPNIVKVDGAGSGSGTVTSDPPLNWWITELDCHITEGVPDEKDVEEGKCEAELEQGELISPDHVAFTPDPGSEFVKCAYAGEGLSECVPIPDGNPSVLVFSGTGEEGTMTVTFEALTYPLNLSTSGLGSGELKCKVNGGPEAECKENYQEGKEVEVIAHPATGSEFAGWTGCDSEPGGNCLVTMTGEKSVNAQFDLETFTLTVEVEGEGEVTAPGITCTEAGNGGVECEEDFVYGTNVEVTAAPAEKSVLASLIGSGSAAGSCDKEAGSCEFAVGEDSGVVAVFAGAETIDQQIENVHGEVPETTELATTCGNDIDLGIFTPGAEERYWEICYLTVTATGEVNELRAEDLTGKGEEGHLTQEAGKTYNLPEPLEISSESTIPLNGADTGGLKPLDEGGVTLMSYPTPVSKDNVEVEFSQWIREHDPLHTGVYSKQITLTLEQTTP